MWRTVDCSELVRTGWRYVLSPESVLSSVNCRIFLPYSFQLSSDIWQNWLNNQLAGIRSISVFCFGFIILSSLIIFVSASN